MKKLFCEGIVFWVVVAIDGGVEVLAHGPWITYAHLGSENVIFQRDANLVMILRSCCRFLALFARRAMSSAKARQATLILPIVAPHFDSCISCKRPFMYIRKRVGERGEPCGRPMLMEKGDERLLLILILLVVFCRS